MDATGLPQPPQFTAVTLDLLYVVRARVHKVAVEVCRMFFEHLALLADRGEDVRQLCDNRHLFSCSAGAMSRCCTSTAACRWITRLGWVSSGSRAVYKDKVALGVAIGIVAGITSENQSRLEGNRTVAGIRVYTLKRLETVVLWGPK